MRVYLQAHGWVVIRSYASKGPYDLLALRPCGELESTVLVVQVKSGIPAYLRPSERAALLLCAHRLGGRAVVAGYEGGRFGFQWLTSMADREEYDPTPTTA